MSAGLVLPPEGELRNCFFFSPHLEAEGDGILWNFNKATSLLPFSFPPLYTPPVDGRRGREEVEKDEEEDAFFFLLLDRALPPSQPTPPPSWGGEV